MRRTFWQIGTLLLLVVGLFLAAQSFMTQSAGASVPYKAPAAAVPVKGGSNALTAKQAGKAFQGKLAAPARPNVVLYDQYDNDLNNGIVSANRTDNASLSAQAGDDFVVPAGQTWSVNEVDVRSPSGFPAPTSFDVYFYQDSATLPGTPVYTATALTVAGNPDYVIPLTTPANLTAGTYWVSVQGEISGSNWYWEGRSVTSNNAVAWRNPGNGYGTGCTNWGRLATCIGQAWPDQMFRIVGTSTGGGATSTPTATPTCVVGSSYTTATATATILAGTTDIGVHCDDCTGVVTFPFPVNFYGQTYTTANASSNGNLQFTGNSSYLGTSCPMPNPNLGAAILLYQDDLHTGGTGEGIFTGVFGTAPNRTFVVEWRTHYFGRTGTSNEEIIFYENSGTITTVYGANADSGASEQVGVQASSTGPDTQFSCLTASEPAGLRVDYIPNTCNIATATVTATATPCAGNVVQNPGFETGTLPPWTVLGTNPPPVVSNAQAHTGTYSALLGTVSGSEPLGDGSMYQQITVPASGGNLTFWYYPGSQDSLAFDWQDAYITDASGTILATIFHQCLNTQTWTQQTFDMTPYAGQTVRIEFLVHQDGFGDDTYMYVDDVSLGGGACTTATVTPTSVGGTATPTCVPGTPGPWAYGNPMAQDLYGAGATDDGTNMYFAGGYSFSSGTSLTLFQRYNPATNTWTTLAPMSIGIVMPSVVYNPGNNKVYVFGGEDVASGTVYNTTQIYDVTAGTWSTGAPMPDVRAFAASGYYNGKMYVVGGYNTGQVTSSQAQVWEYDPVANTWNTSRLNMPAPLGGPGFGVINGHLYVAGGRDGSNTALNTLYDYDIAANTWTTGPNLPAGVNVPASAVQGGKLWIMGGGNPFNGAGSKNSKAAFTAPSTTNTVYEYTPGGSWTNGQNLLEPVSFPAGASVGQYVAVAGGYNGSSTVNHIEVATAGSSCTTPTATATVGGATATPTCVSGPVVVQGSIDSSDPTQNGRLFRGGIASTCGAPNNCSTLSGSFHYDLYQFQNTSNAQICVTVTLDTACTGTNFIFSGAYLNSFDPNNICLNNVGDPGVSPNGAPVTYQFYVPANTTFYINVAEVTSGGGCSGYTVTVDGLPGTCNTTPTVTPTTGAITSTPTATPTCGAGGTPGPWTAASPVPVTIARYAFAQDPAGNFYVIGGVSSGQVVNTLYRYTPSSNTWTTLAAAPGTFGEAPAGAYYNGKIYVAPGLGETSFFIYDVAGNSWTTGPSYPGSGYGEAAGAYNGKFYTIGGNATSDTWIFDIAANSWSAGTAAPATYFLGGYQQVGQYLYAVGSYGSSPLKAGTSASSVLNAGKSRAQAPASNGTETMRLDLATGTYSSGPTWTMQRADFGLASDGTKLFAIGGDANGGSYFDPQTEVDELDLGAWPSGTWTVSPPALTSARQANQAGFYGDGKIWSVGAYLGGGVFLDENLYRTQGGSCAGTPTATVTETPVPPTLTPTNTPTTPPTATDTATSVPVTGTATETETAVPGTPTVTPTECVMNFSDVHTTDYFYNDVHCVYCLGAVSGYADGTFRPYNNTTRGQMTKIIVIALQIPIVTPTGTPTFNDVPANSPFYPWIETSVANQIVSGYNCGDPGEPCPGLYFRPNNNVTRGQLSKIAVVAAVHVFGWDLLNPVTPTFVDVPRDNPFYEYIETAYCHGVISGYADSTFRPGFYAIRAQIAKIVCKVSQNPANTCPVPPTTTPTATR